MRHPKMKEYAEDTTVHNQLGQSESRFSITWMKQQDTVENRQSLASGSKKELESVKVDQTPLQESLKARLAYSYPYKASTRRQVTNLFQKSSVYLKIQMIRLIPN